MRCPLATLCYLMLEFLFKFIHFSFHNCELFLTNKQIRKHNIVAGVLVYYYLISFLYFIPLYYHLFQFRSLTKKVVY